MNKLLILVFLSATLGCVTKTNLKNSEAYFHYFIPNGTQDLSPIALEGNKYFIVDNHSCKILSDTSYVPRFITELKQKLNSLGFVEADSVKKSHIHFGFNCEDNTPNLPDSDTSVQTTVGTNIWNKITKIDSGQISIQEFYNNLLYAYVKTSTKSKIINFRFYGLQEKNNLSPQNITASNVLFGDDKNFLDDHWAKAIFVLLADIDPLKNKAPKNSTVLMCTPRFGIEWDIDAANAFIVKTVKPNSPASKIGLKPNDVILFIAKTPAKEFFTLNKTSTDILEQHIAVPIQFRRGGRKYTHIIKSASICESTQ